jgi:tetratricopeptide (TPR) repeat protein
MRAHWEESAQTYYDRGDYQASVKQWQKVLTIEPNDPKANWGLAMSYAKIGTPASLRQSEQIFVKIVDWDWSHPTLGDRKHEVRKDFAQVYLELADYYDRDVRVLEDRRREDDSDPTVGQKIQTQVAARNALLQKAMPLYEQVLAQSPDNPYALAGIAKAQILIGDEVRGIEHARRYLEISRKSRIGWQAKLDAFQKENELVTDEQREMFKGKIRGASEKELRMHLLVATVLMRRRDYAGALAEYDEILAIDPARPAAYVERAQAHAGLKDYKKAIVDLQEYLKITDPIRHRQGRIGAADLLDRYRALSDPHRPAPRAAHPPAPAPAGSPDGA